mmetsp:Transcript_53177/g.78931  ORF Transcript_53177/g.78931 Transcript_53177/m.78931 type:complete len:240 (-) Transcript_53177:14-733(-)
MGAAKHERLRMHCLQNTSIRRYRSTTFVSLFWTMMLSAMASTVPRTNTMGPWAGNTCTPFRKLKSNSKRRRGDLDDLVQAGARSTTNFAFRLRGGGGDDEYYQHYGGGYGDDRENEEYYRRKGSGSSNGNRGRQNQGYDYDYRESGSSSSSRRSPQQGDYEYGSGDSRDGGQYYEGEEDYYGTAPARERSRRSSGYSGSTPLSSIPGMSNIMTKGNKKIGMSFSAGGLLFTLLGISLFF